MQNDSHESHEAKVSEVRREYAAALLSGDEVAAELVIREARDANLCTADIDEDVIAPALWLVGELWEQGRISVADEHLATEISIRMLALQREARRTARARRDHREMLAAPAGELHVVALRMVDNLLREAGYEIVMLGQSVPDDALARSATRFYPHAVCLTATMPASVDQALSSINEVQQQWPNAGFVLGGRGATDLLRSQCGIDVCQRVSEVVEAVDAIIKRAGLN